MAGFTLTLGSYADPSFVGMKGILTRSFAYVDSSGNVSPTTWTVTIAADGTGSIPGLPFTDDGGVYTMQWQALSWKATPGNRTLPQVLAGSGVSAVDFDLITQNVAIVPPTVALDAAVASLLTNRQSATYAAAVSTPSYPNGA